MEQWWYKCPSDKIDLKGKKYGTRDKEKYFLLTERLIQQEGTTTLNAQASNNIVWNHVQQQLTRLKGDTREATPWLEMVSSRQDKMNQPGGCRRSDQHRQSA